MDIAPRPLSVSLFGAPTFLVDGTPSDLALPKAAVSVLAYLIVFRNESLKRDRVAFALWPDEIESDARANLRRQLYLLARASPLGGAPLVIADARTVRWNRDSAASVDVVTFDEHVDDPAMRAIAVGSYGGDLLEHFEAAWLEEPRLGYRERFCDAALEEARLAARDGEPGRAVILGQRVLAADPWREDAIRMMMTSRHANGDRAGALALYREFANRLSVEIGAEPMVETQRLCERLRAERATSEETVAVPSRTVLPLALSHFIGRTQEIATITRLLSGARLVTVTGPGGVGKSRLAVEVAVSLRAEFSSEPVFVELVAASDDRASVESRVLEAFGVVAGDEPVVDVIARAAGPPSRLIVIDNADHVVDAAASFVRDLLARSKMLHILVTSQRRLEVGGEHVVVLPPLGLPAPSAATHEVMDSEAVRLFLDRAILLNGDFAVPVEEQMHVVSICRRLDGMPLSIELAAARTNVLTPAEIDARLSDRFALLRTRKAEGASHHRTLRATLDWSFHLLDETEKKAFRRLGVFPAGWTLAAAAAVTRLSSDEEVDILECLSGLIEKSLSFASHGTSSTRRYAYLETVRAYAVERLIEANERELAERAAFNFYARFVAERRTKFSTGEEKRVFDEIAADHDNILAGLDAAIARNETSRAAVLTCDLAPFWIVRGFAGDAQPRLDTLVAADYGLEPALRARLRTAASMVYFRRGRFSDAALLAEQGVGFANEAEDEGLLADALLRSAWCASMMGSISSAASLLDRALPLFERSGDAIGMARTMDSLASLADSPSEAERSAELFAKSLKIYESHGDLQGVAFVNFHLGFRANSRGDWEAAMRYNREASTVWHELGNLQGENWAQYNLACALAGLGDYAGAAHRHLACVQTAHRHGFSTDVLDGFDRLAAIFAQTEAELSLRCLAFASRMRERRGYIAPAVDRVEHETSLSRLRSAFAPDDFERIWESGVARDQDALIGALTSAVNKHYGLALS